MNLREQKPKVELDSTEKAILGFIELHPKCKRSDFYEFFSFKPKIINLKITSLLKKMRVMV